MAKSSGTVWRDIDVVAVKGELPIIIIGCKVSLHGRFTETLFWIEFPHKNKVAIYVNKDVDKETLDKTNLKWLLNKSWGYSFLEFENTGFDVAQLADVLEKAYQTVSS